MISQIWNGKLGGLRLIMLIAVTGLVGTGLACIHSSGHSSEFKKQLFWLAISFCSLIVVSNVSYRKLGHLSGFLFLITNILLAIVLVGKHLGISSLVPMIGGSFRWINIAGFRIQPSELAKLSYILSLAWYLKDQDCSIFKNGIIYPFFLAAVPMALIFLEPDLGTVLLFIPTSFAMIFMAGAKIRHLLTIVLIALIMAPIGYFFFMEDYQKKRIEGLFRQNTTDVDWLQDKGYQLHKSKMCIGSGGIGGQRQDGLFVKYDFLPDRHNDFIFAMIGHQWGIIGCSSILGLYVLIIFGAAEIASEQKDPFGKLVAVGVAALISAQTCVNVSMTIGLAPVTGMTLPFISYGGTSLVCNFISLGLLINIARHQDQSIRKPRI